MRTFSAKETEWLLELDGIELAGFWRRALAFLIDWILVTIVFSLLATLGTAAYLEVRHLQHKTDPTFVDEIKAEASKGDQPGGKKESKSYHVAIGPGEGSGLTVNGKPAEHNEALKIVTDVVIPVLYFGILLWTGKGRTPGKRVAKIRVVSVVHRHLSFWHCVERALGYGAAALEGGFGFVQFFIHPYRRCAQDRLAETIVVTERSYRSMQHKFEHALVPDTPAGEQAPE